MSLGDNPRHGPAAARPTAWVPAQPPGPHTEGFAIASLACGIGAFFFVPVVGSILAIIFGSVARRRIAEDPNLQGADMARAGIIIGWIGLVLLVLFIIFLVVVAVAVQNWNF